MANVGLITQNDPLHRRRILTDRVMTWLMAVSAVIAVLPFVLMIYYVVTKGLPAFTLDLLIADPKRPGVSGGGVRNSIIGSAMMVGGAVAIGTPIAVGCGVFLAEFAQNRGGTVFRFLVDVLAGIPSITAGLFIYALVVLPMREFTAMAGVLSLAVLFLPVVARTTEEMLLLVPRSLREASLALGAPMWRTAFSVVLPSALPGIITGVVLALARITGEAAPLLFTSLGNQFTNTDYLHATDALPLRIFVYASGPYDSWHEQAWAMSFLLVAFMFVVSISMRFLARGSNVRRR